MLYYIVVDETRAVGIENENAELVLLFTEYTTQELGELVCQFLNLGAARDTVKWFYSKQGQGENNEQNSKL